MTKENVSNLKNYVLSLIKILHQMNTGVQLPPRKTSDEEVFSNDQKAMLDPIREDTAISKIICCESVFINLTYAGCIL